MAQRHRISPSQHSCETRIHSGDWQLPSGEHKRSHRRSGRLGVPACLVGRASASLCVSFRSRIRRSIVLCYRQYRPGGIINIVSALHIQGTDRSGQSFVFWLRECAQHVVWSAPSERYVLERSSPAAPAASPTIEERLSLSPDELRTRCRLQQHMGPGDYAAFVRRILSSSA
jgi:hypothetical protein